VSTNEIPPGDWRRAVYGRSHISGTDRRRTPPLAERARIIADQGNRCLYCEIPIGTTVSRQNRSVTLQLNWDHFLPYGYMARNPRDNWVLACHVCNKIKWGRFFKTVQEARDVILPARLAKGYEDPLDVLRRLSRIPTVNLWPDRLRLIGGEIVHYAKQTSSGMWSTACGLERETSRWRTQAGSQRYCDKCVVESGIATPQHELGNPE
jgi:5-methylcytosine-specific restriction endonuclease McrA